MLTIVSRRLTPLLWTLLGTLASSACAYYVPTIRNDTTARFVLEDSPKHRFLDRVAYVDEAAEQTVVYGTVEHHHERCPAEGHVRLVVVDPAGRTWAQQSVPIVNRGGRSGWPGADFRTRLDGIPPANSELRLSFHDHQCSREGIFDCGDGERSEDQH